MLIHRDINIGRWRCDFFFADGNFDGGSVMECLEDMYATDDILQRCWETMTSGAFNEGFTYSRSDSMRSCIFIGPTTNGAQFLDTLVHEIRHLADDIASYLGISLRGERVAYLSGDAAYDLADVICRLGCTNCGHRGHSL